MDIDLCFLKSYEYIYRKYYNLHKYNISKKSKLLYLGKLKGFKKRISKHYNLQSLGQKWIFDFCVFQFKRLENANIMRFTDGNGGGRIIFDDITRTKSMEMYLLNIQNEHYSYFQRQFCERYNIIFNECFQPTQPEQIIDKGSRLLDIERNRFLNTIDGFIHCKEQVLSYNEQSTICSKCNFKNKCINE